MSFLITGGVGYLGARVVTALAQKFPADQIVYTHHKTPAKNHFEAYANVQFKKLDLTTPADYNDLCKDINTVIHLAYPNEIICQQNPDLAIDAGIKGTNYLLSDADKNGVSNFVFLSTASVYGPLKGDVTEETVARPENVYGITKKATEDFVLIARKKTKMNTIVLRLSNGYGYPLNAEINRWTLLVNDLCKQAVVNKQMVMRSSGTALRDFTPFTDVIGAILFLLDQPAEKLGNGLFNLSSGKSVSVYDFAMKISAMAKELLGYDIPLSRQPVDPNEKVTELNYSIDKLLALGFKPQQNADEEIKETLRFCHVHFGEGAAK